MALTVKARTEIKCRFWGVDENGHEQGAQNVYSHKGTAYAETEEEMMFRYYMAMVLISYPILWKNGKKSLGKSLENFFLNKM